ncbi:tenascin isoform X1 [Gadus macrocephalus]|uniref:tenascin isoform X1 n=1 Tax=Gadus macrocephalus TaxID=80720 RepID=UPI0028CBAE47|nr:tenascin isoform X1 [Gadus macrocephalus]XP_059911254.1 tenascin isoform X1 [Gadus macrocephalus]
MLLSLCLVLLITSVPARHTPANEKRNSTGSDTIKSDATVTPSILKYIPALAKQTTLASPKPNVADQTTPTPLMVKQKPVVVNGTKTTKVKKASALSHALPSTSPKTLPAAIKDKHAINKTRTPPTRDVKIIKNKLVAAVTDGATKTAKDKPTASTNQTTSIKSPAISISGPTVFQGVQSTHTPSSEAVTEKPGLIITKPASKDRPTTSVNQTSTSNVRSAKAIKTPAVTSGPKDAGTSERCDGVHTTKQEVKLKPGSPLVVTHKISLVPAGCSESCQAEMEALRIRVERLEKEMTALKGQRKCPNECNGNGECEMGRCVCSVGFQGPDCSRCAPGVNCETKGDKGKVKTNVEMVKIPQDKNTKAEQTLSQKKEQTLTLATPGKVSTVKTQARQETTAVKINTKDSASARKSVQLTVGQVLLKHKGRKQEEAREGRTTALASRELSPKSEAKQVMMKEGVMANAHATAGQLQDQPQTNVTLGAQEVTNGTAKVQTLLTKAIETSDVKKSLHPSTLAEKDVTQSSAHTLIKEVKTGSVNNSHVVQTVDNKKTQMTKISSGKAILSRTTAGKDKQTTSVKTLSSDVKPALTLAKTVLSTATKKVAGGNTTGKEKQVSAVDQITSVKTHTSDIKPALTVAKTVLSTATKNATGGNTTGKDKQVSAVDHITTVKTHSSGVKTVVSTASKTVKTTGTTDSKDKPTTSVSQKTSLKTLSDLKPNTETTILTEVRTTQSRVTKPATGRGTTTITKDKSATSVLTSDLTTLVNQSADAKSTKDTPVDPFLVTKSSTNNATLSAKDKPTPTANHTEVIKSHRDGKAAKTQTSKVGSGKAKGTQKSQTSVNVTSVEHGEASAKETLVQVTGDTATQQHTSRKSGGGLGSVKVSDVSSYSFTLTWSAPAGMFKNFTVIRREQRMEAEGTVDEEAADGQPGIDDMATTASKNMTAGQALKENTDATASSAKATGSRGKAEEQRISLVLPGNVRAVDFDHLQANTRYLLQIFGTASGRRSKIHRTSITTGPEPATEMVFSNVTESSVTVSWSKPKSAFTGFRVTYTNSITGESSFEAVEFQPSHVVLSHLGAGSSYIITVTTSQGHAQSDALTSHITTVPAPPLQFRVVDVTDTRALLQWTPSPGRVDRFIISYESAKIPNVTVTVMVSGRAVEHQLRALQRGTVYRVKALSQKNSFQSQAVSTTFTTASTVKPSAVGPRSAVITWKTSSISYQRYRITYHGVGEESKEVILDPTVTEYRLTRLQPVSRYVVLVQGERDGLYTSVVTSEFVTGTLRFPSPADCSEELQNGARPSGEADIYPQGREGGAQRVYCDMETDGGGWTVFQRRMNGNTDFYRSWSEYRVGFGNVSQEFWIGNELLHHLTQAGSMAMRVELRAENETAYAHYSTFSVASEENHYSLQLSGFTGTAGDSMKYHNGRPFSTHDQDPDPLGIHCARAYMGGWWYKNCYKANLNGLYGVGSNNQGVVWIDWKGKDSSLPSTEMKIRPAAFSPSTAQG